MFANSWRPIVTLNDEVLLLAVTRREIRSALGVPKLLLCPAQDFAR